MNEVKKDPNGVPKIKGGAEYYTYPEIYMLKEVGEYVELGKYTRKLMQTIGSFVYYYNRSRKPNKLCMRTVNGNIRIYKEI